MIGFQFDSNGKILLASFVGSNVTQLSWSNKTFTKDDPQYQDAINALNDPAHYTYVNGEWVVIQ